MSSWTSLTPYDSTRELCWNRKGSEDLMAFIVRSLSTRPSALFLCMILCSVASASCPSNQTAEEEALQSLYSDNELVNYVCGPGTRCSDAEFSSRLDVSQVTISSS